MEARFYRGIVEGISCGVMTIGRDGRVLTVNRPARQVLELEDRSHEGRPCSEVLRHHPRLAEVLLGSFSCETLPSRAEMALRGRDGTPRIIGFSISRICEPGDPPQGAAIFFRDLTLVEQQEEQARLRDRLAALGQMAAHMAHEIRNPVASIAVTAQLIRRRLAALGEPTELVDRLVREIGRIEGTIAGSLTYVRPLSLSCRPCSLPTLLAEAAEEARRRCGAADLQVDIRPDPAVGEAVCDGPRLREVFCNLFVNSIQAMEGRGRIAVRMTAGEPGSGGGAAQIEISDTGPGVPAELRDRVFYPFFTTKTSGTGIGLAMARKVIEAHRGLIDIVDRPGGGATFAIRLPLRTPAGDGEGSERARDEAISAASGGARGRVATDGH